MANLLFQGFVYNNVGVAVEGATVHLYDRGTTTPSRDDTTTNSDGFWTISHAGEGRFDVEITNGTSVERLKYDDAVQMEEAEFGVLKLRDSNDDFKYIITAGNIAADRILNLPVLTGTATVVVTPAVEDLNLAGFNIDDGGVIFLKEQAAADADVAASGQFWVRTATPNLPMFTDDAGTDFQLGQATAVAQATQAEAEGEDNLDKYLPPDLLKHSPGVAKVWCSYEMDGAHSMNIEYNMTSMDDGGGAGDSDALFDIDFTTANWAAGSSCENAGVLQLPAGGTQAAGGCTVLARNIADGVLTDYSDPGGLFVIFGVQV